MRSSSDGNVVGAVLIGCLLIFASFFVSSFLIMLAWNAVIPAVFGAPPLNYPMSLALTFLLGLTGNLLFRRNSK